MIVFGWTLRGLTNGDRRFHLSANISFDNHSCILQTSPVVSVAAEPSIHVRVEHSGLDTSHMKIEDFTSQQQLEPIEYVGIDHMEEICSVESPSGMDYRRVLNFSTPTNFTVKTLKFKLRSSSML